jgi:hypothetical protein
VSERVGWYRPTSVNTHPLGLLPSLLGRRERIREMQCLYPWPLTKPVFDIWRSRHGSQCSDDVALKTTGAASWSGGIGVERGDVRVLTR